MSVKSLSGHVKSESYYLTLSTSSLLRRRCHSDAYHLTIDYGSIDMLHVFAEWFLFSFDYDSLTVRAHTFVFLSFHPLLP